MPNEEVTPDQTTEALMNLELDAGNQLQELQNTFAAEYSEQLGGNQAIDPAIWGVIIDALAGMIKGCMASRVGATVSSGNESAHYLRVAQRSGPLARFHVMRHVRPALQDAYGQGSWRRYNGPAIVESVMHATATKLRAETIQAFVEEVKRSG